MHIHTRAKSTLGLFLTSLPDQFQDIHSPDKLSYHDIVSGTFQKFAPHTPQTETSEKGVFCTRGDYESMTKEAFEFAKEKYFNGYSDAH